jgi:hypothetical protein
MGCLAGALISTIPTQLSANQLLSGAVQLYAAQVAPVGGTTLPTAPTHARTAREGTSVQEGCTQEQQAPRTGRTAAPIVKA